MHVLATATTAHTLFWDSTGVKFPSLETAKMKLYTVSVMLKCNETVNGKEIILEFKHTAYVTYLLPCTQNLAPYSPAA